MINNIYSLELNTEKPAVQVLHRSDKVQVTAIGLLRGQLLKKHLTSNPAMICVVEGTLDFQTETESISLRSGDTMEIPVDIPHEVTGMDDRNIFLLIRES